MGRAGNFARKALAVLAISWASAASAQAACVDPFEMGVAHGVAPFTQTRHITGVRAPLVSRGQATFTHDRVEWHVSEPIDIRTVISAAGVTQSVDNGPPQQFGPAGGGADAFMSSAGLRALMTGDFDGLNQHYEVDRRNASANGDWLVRLTPRAAAMSRVVSYIDVGGCEQVARVDVRQANGDRMEIALGRVGG